MTAINEDDALALVPKPRTNQTVRIAKAELGCRLALLFHSGSPWDNEKAIAWTNLIVEIMGDKWKDSEYSKFGPPATTRLLCDALREAIEL